MSSRPRWISKNALLILHEQSLAEFGGARGLRDEGLLESALARPLHILAYRPDTTIAELAAACGNGVAKNHAFLDGNKRAAFLRIGVFLVLNGYRLTVPQVTAVQTILGLAAGELTEDALAHWIAQHAKPGRAA